MEDNTKTIESLLKNVAEYGTTSFELVKLKALDKTADAVSSFIPQSVFLALIGAFMLFLSLGIALWLGEILGKTYFGFFVVAAFYITTGIIFYFLMRKWIKKIVSNYVIKQMLK